MAAGKRLQSKVQKTHTLNFVIHEYQDDDIEDVTLIDRYGDVISSEEE